MKDTAFEWGISGGNAMTPALFPLSSIDFEIASSVLRSRGSPVRIGPSAPSYIPSITSEIAKYESCFDGYNSAGKHGKARQITVVDEGKVGETPAHQSSAIAPVEHSSLSLSLNNFNTTSVQNSWFKHSFNNLKRSFETRPPP